MILRHNSWKCSRNHGSYPRKTRVIPRHNLGSAIRILESFLQEGRWWARGVIPGFAVRIMETIPGNTSLILKRSSESAVRILEIIPERMWKILRHNSVKYSTDPGNVSQEGGEWSQSAISGSTLRILESIREWNKMILKNFSKDMYDLGGGENLGLLNSFVRSRFWQEFFISEFVILEFYLCVFTLHTHHVVAV